MDYTDERLFWVSAGRVPPFSIPSAQVVPGVGSSRAPAVTVLGNVLYMAWKGASGLRDDESIWFSHLE